MKTLKKVIIVVLILIIAIIIGLVAILKKQPEVDLTQNQTEEEYTIAIDENIHILENRNLFYTIEKCINKNLENNSKENFAEKIWEIDLDDNISAYYVKTYVRDLDYTDISNQQEKYYTVAIDKINETFEIVNINDTYSDKDLNDISKIDLKEITSNVTNKFEFDYPTDTDVILRYFEEYKINAQYNIANAYSLLDEEYKNKKFGNQESYNQYVQSNIEKIKNQTIIKYAKEEKGGYIQYTIVDNSNNYIIVKEKSIMDYTILLDNYTLISDEFETQYNNASDSTKIATNVDKIFSLINNKEYNQIYSNYLNEEYRNSNFSTYESFEEYMKNKFFDYNYTGSATTKQDGSYYIITVPYKDGISPSAEQNSVSIIMDLQEGTDFKIAFNLE